MSRPFSIVVWLAALLAPEATATAQEAPGAAGGAAPSRGARGLDAPDARLREVLSQPVTLEFSETPLADVAKSLSQTHAISIQIDRSVAESQAAGHGVTCNLHDLTLESALGLVLDDLGLTWVLRHETLLITTPARAESMVEARVYDVADLLTTGTAGELEAAVRAGLGSSPERAGQPARSDADARPFDARVARYAEALFKQFDLNADGMLQKDEWSKMRGDPKASDKDGDDVLSRDEVAEQLAGELAPASTDVSAPADGVESKAASKHAASVAVFGHLLVVRQSQPRHRELELLLGQLRQAARTADTSRRPASRNQARQPSAQFNSLAGMIIQRSDKNGDGKVTEDELPSTQRADAARYDADGDGKLDQGEIAAWLVGRFPGVRQSRRSEPTEGGETGKTDPDTIGASLVQRMDKDRDGKVVEDELPASVRQWFRIADADTNGDGGVDAAEMAAAIRKRRSESRAPDD